MRTSVGTHREQHAVRPNLVAREALLLWPRAVGAMAATAQDASLWPVFAVVLGERDPEDDPAVGPLFDLLERPERRNRITVVEGRCEWTIIDPRHALLELAVHASAPVRFDVDIILPARTVIGTLSRLAHGGTVAITSQRHAATLTGRVDIRDALSKLVLFSCPPSEELAALAASVSQAVC